MIRFWMGALSLSAAWLALFPVFRPAILWGQGIAFAVLGMALLVWGAESFQVTSGLQLFCKAEARRRALWFGIVVMVWQFLALHSLTAIAANHHSLSLLTPVVLIIARCLGLPAASESGLLFFDTEEGVVPFLTNWEKVGFVMPITLAVTLGVAIVSNARSWAKGFLFGLGSWCGLGLYELLRYVFLCLWLIEFGDTKGVDDQERLEVFTGLWPTLLSHVPLVLLISRLRCLVPSLAGAGASKRGCTKSWFVATFSLALAVCLGVVSAKLELAGQPKQGKVLVDDYHSGFWEPSLPALDVNGFGTQRLYNASSLVEFLGYYFSVEINRSSPITDELLRGVAVLVIKTPSKRLSATEISLVASFVRKGGGLLLIGDHTNLLGMGSYLNELAVQFGIHFQLDGSNAYSSGYFSSFQPPVLFAHPIVQGLPRVGFLTSCTLRYDSGVEPVMIAQDVMSDPGDYSKPSFFGKLNPSSKNGFGLFPLAVARDFGEGRVVAFAESTTLSNFAVFQDGTAPFFVRALHYLNQANRHLVPARWVLRVVACLLMVYALRRLKGAPRTVRLYGLTAGVLLGFLSGGVVLHRVHAAVWRSPLPRQTVPYVAHIVGPGFTHSIPPAIGPAFVREEDSFDAVFVAPQRFGAFPISIPVSELAHPNHRAALAINPSDMISLAELRHLAGYVSSGGRLIVFQDSVRGAAFVPRLLAQLVQTEPLFVRQIPLPPGNSQFTNATPVAGLHPAGAVSTDPPPSRSVSWTAWTAGSGAVHVLSDSSAFSRAGLGNVMAEPAEQQLRAYELLFSVLSNVLGTINRPLPGVLEAIPPSLRE